MSVSVNNIKKDVIYSEFVESLGRLYKYQKFDKKRLDKLLTDKKINKQEYEYIVSQKQD